MELNTRKAARQKKKDFILTICYLLSIGALVYFFLRYAVSWLFPFLFGFAVATLLRPAARWISRITRIQHKGIFLFVIALFYAAILLFLWLALGFFIGQIGEFLRALPTLYQKDIAPALEQLKDWLFHIVQKLSPGMADAVSEGLKSAFSSLGSNLSRLSGSVVISATSLAAKLPFYLLTLIFSIVCSILISLDYQNILSFFKKQLPPPLKAVCRETLLFLKGSLLKILKAYGLILAITFFELLTGFLLLGISYALPLAALVALLDILPFLGTGIILIPWGFFSIIGGNQPLGAGLLILYLIIALIRNLLEPRLVGDQIGLHPVLTITAMYAGMKILGFAGFFLAPLAVIIVQFLNQRGKIHLYRD